jgi:rare lipoprotein A
MLRTGLRAAGIAIAILVVSACAQTRLAVFAVKEIARDTAASEGNYKVGNPYQVNGVWYTPAEDPFYDETGIASWYGQAFHGQRTANGERYDMYALTAAHKTLPMPTHVRVTNLENGRSMVLRLNDRGPFVNGRIIDVSYRAAQLLGFAERGIARIRVEAVAGPGRAVVASNVSAAPNVSAGAGRTVSVTDLPELSGAGPVAQAANFVETLLPSGVTLVDMAPTEMFVQAGAFVSYDSANQLRMELEPLGNVGLSSITVKELRFYRVRIGPMDSVSRADATLAMVMARGHSEARIIVD